MKKEGTDPFATNPDLERAIEEAPHNEATYLVYADYLQSKGDPRGELIALQAKGKTEAADALIDDNEHYFLGNLREKGKDAIELHWELGYLRSAKVMVLRKHEDEGMRQGPLLDKLLALPSSRFLRDLTIGCLSIHEDNYATANVEALVQGGPRPTLRSLSFETDTEEEMLSWTSAGNLGPIWHLYPNLDRLHIHAGSFQLGEPSDFRLPKLVKMTLETCALKAESLQALASNDWPLLEDLEIWFGSEGKGRTAGPAGLGSLLTGSLTPNLTRLGIINSESTDDICDLLATSPLLGRVVDLDLSRGTMTDAGAKLLTDAIRKLPKNQRRLRKINVEENYLTDEGIDRFVDIEGVENASGNTWQREIEVYDGTEYRICAMPE